MIKDAKVFLAGHDRLLMTSLLNRFGEKRSKHSVITGSGQPDLTDQRAVGRFFYKERPELVILTSLGAGGILANIRQPADFIYSNLQAECNVINSAFQFKVKRLIFFASSCVYPKDSPQPMKERYLLSGHLEPTSEAFAVAKIAGIKLCQYYNRQYGTDFISVIPATAFGPYDNFDPHSSHVIPGLIRRIHEAKVKGRPYVTVWGSGRPRREFIFADDLADATLFLLSKRRVPEIINIGSGRDIRIAELAKLVKKIAGYKGDLKFDSKKPDGAPIKLLDVGLLRSIGWKAPQDLEGYIGKTYEWFVKSL